MERDYTKKKIVVDDSGSEAIRRCRKILRVVAWISLAVGVYLALNELEEDIPIIAGSVFIANSVSIFILNIILLGLQRITKVSEYNAAIIEQEYQISLESEQYRRRKFISEQSENES